MRQVEVLIRSKDHRGQRQVVVTEAVHGEQGITLIRRECTYAVSVIKRISHLSQAIKWAKGAGNDGYHRQVYVTKDLSSGKENVIYHVNGMFYAVDQQAVYRVGYRHILAMNVMEAL